MLEDVLDRQISLAAARDVYGVVLDEATWTVNLQLTAQRRAELAAASSPMPQIYDRGSETF